MSLRKQVSDFINAESLLSQGSRVIVGLSGGADSVALLALLSELGYECIALHCHFGLRGEEADRDAAHAAKIAARLGAKFEEIRFYAADYARKNRISIEMACRDLRYAEFERLRDNYSAEAIAVGHHREDNIETLLLNLLRGSGLHGLKGMLPKRDHIIRPLLDTPREEIIKYLSERHLDYIVDSSNLNEDFRRNRIRNSVIPALTKAFPDAPEAIGRSLRNLRDCDALYRSLLPERTDSLDGVSSTLLHEWLAPFGFNPTQCRDMLTAESGAVFRSRTHILTICPQKKYYLQEIDTENPRPRLTYRILTPGEQFKPQEGKLYLDAEGLSTDDNWEISPWRKGDRMKPFGMGGYRMVSDIMNELKIPASLRPVTWLLRRNGEILWIIGRRASAHFPITEKTTKIIEISQHP